MSAEKRIEVDSETLEFLQDLFGDSSPDTHLDRLGQERHSLDEVLKGEAE